MLNKQEATFGYFDGENKVPGKRLRVILVQYEFKNFKGWYREGNSRDVKNLVSTFEQRGIQIENFASTPIKEVLEILSGKKSAQNDESTEVLILIILSHGRENGKILTDETIKPKMASPKSVRDFVCFNTEDIFDAIQKNEALKICRLKMLFFGPCRGKNLETLVTRSVSEPDSSTQDTDDACRILCKPNVENTIVFYSTVETTMSVRYENGTWMIQALLHVLETMDSDLPIDVFLNRVQHEVQAKSLGSGTGQTAEIRLFAYNDFYVCKSVVKNPDQLYCDANCNKSRMTSLERRFFYNWKSISSHPLRRGSAVVFHDSQMNLAEKLKTPLEELGYVTFTHNIDAQMKSFSEIYKHVSCEDGSLMACVIAKISVQGTGTSQELCIELSGTDIPIKFITSQFTGSQFPKLVGRPKIFLILDPGRRSDYLVPSLQLGSYEVSGDHGDHSDIVVYIGIGQDIVEDVVLNLFPALQKGSTLLHALNGISRKAKRGDETSKIFSQTTNTFPISLDFPKEEHVFISPTFTVIGGQTTSFGFEKLKKNLKSTLRGDFNLVCSIDPTRKCERQTIVSAASGMGKSEITRELAKWLEYSTDHLVVLLQISSFVQFFQEHSPNRKYATQILEHALNNNEAKRQNLNLKIVTKKVFLLVDGFDECCENIYVKNRVKAFLKNYLRYECPLWITTRPHVLKELKSIMENDFVRVLDINPFNRENQREIFSRKAKMSMNECEAFLDGFDEKGGKDLASNPLHLCMMAEAVRNNLQIDHKLFALYDTFLHLKIQNALVAEGYTVQKIKDKMLARRITVLKAAALTLKGESAQSLSEEEIRDINNVGLAIVANNTIRYVHESFYEFLVAQLYLLPEDLRESSNFFVDTQEVFVKKDLHHIRKQIDNYCEAGRGIEDGDNFFAALCSSSEAFSTAMSLICKEGLIHIFQTLLNSDNTITNQVIEFWSNPESFQTQGYIFLYNACCTNEKLAMMFMAMGANLQELLDTVSKEPEKLIFLLNEVSARNFTSLIQKIVETGSNHSNFHQALLSNLAKNTLTALHSAAANNNLEILQILMSQGLDLNSAPKEIGLTPLGCAALRGHTDCVRHLLNLCSTNSKSDETSLDPLHAAVVSGHKDVVRILLDNGADVNAKAHPDNSFFKDVAFWRKQKQYQGKTPLHLAVQVGNLEVVKMLLGAGARVDDQDDNLKTALHHAALMKRNDCLEYFLQVEGVEIERGMTRLRTPLHLACLVGNMGGVEMLIAKGANVQAEDMHLRTPLHYAAFAKEYECVRLLLQVNAGSLGHTSIYGETALHFASENKDANVMQLLIDSGIDVQAENLNMQRALQDYSDSVCKQLRPDLTGVSVARNWIKCLVIVLPAFLISFFVVYRSYELLPDYHFIGPLYILVFTVHFSLALELFSHIPMRYKSCRKFFSWPMSLETFIFLMPFLALLIWYLPNLTYTVIFLIFYEQLYLHFILLFGFLIIGVLKFLFYMIDSFYCSSDLANMIKYDKM